MYSDWLNNYQKSFWIIQKTQHVISVTVSWVKNWTEQRDEVQIQIIWRNKHPESHQILLWSKNVYRREESSEISFNFWDSKVDLSSLQFINSSGSEENGMWLEVFIPPEGLVLHLTLSFFRYFSFLNMIIFWFLSSSLTVNWISLGCGQNETFWRRRVGFQRHCSTFSAIF